MRSTGASPITTDGWSLNGLSTELLALIFEQLHDIDSRSLSSVRCLCRRFDAMVIPIIYRELALNERMVAEGAENQHPQAFQHIRNYTIHVIARSDLDPRGIRKVLDNAYRLQSVRWRVINAQFSSGPYWMPSDVLSHEEARRNGIRLFVEDLPLRSFEGKHQDTYLRAIPSEFLVSLKLAHATPPLTTRLYSLKQLLLASRRLKTLHYRDRGQGTNFSFVGEERLPAFEELALRCYDWNHSSQEVAAHWDFSKIRSLTLVSVPIFNFLASVSFPDFSELHTLHVEDFSAHLHDRRVEATQGLYNLVKFHIRALQHLQITCHTDHFAVDAILKHRSSLRTLSLRDHVGFSEDDRVCPTLGAPEVFMLSTHLSNLHTLELDMDIVDPASRQAFLRGLCAFPALHTLTLHLQTVLLRERDATTTSSDPDRDATARVFAFLARNKQRTTTTTTTSAAATAPSWRRITAIVGGWRPDVMMRRLGEVWREHHSRGLFAERCFAMERENGVGKFVFREVKVRGSDISPATDAGAGSALGLGTGFNGVLQSMIFDQR